MEAHTNREYYSVSKVKYREMEIYRSPYYFISSPCWYVLFHYFRQESSVRHVFAPMKTDHYVHIQWTSSQGHHRNGFQSATCIFKHWAGAYCSVTLSAISIQLHNPLLSRHSTILIIYLCISFFSSLVTQSSAALLLSSSNLISFCSCSFFLFS